jgi:hypothetical protein
MFYDLALGLGKSGSLRREILALGSVRGPSPELWQEQFDEFDRYRNKVSSLSLAGSRHILPYSNY